jgi:hypothetical protein
MSKDALEFLGLHGHLLLAILSLDIFSFPLLFFINSWLSLLSLVNILAILEVRCVLLLFTLIPLLRLTLAHKAIFVEPLPVVVVVGNLLDGIARASLTINEVETNLA